MNHSKGMMVTVIMAVLLLTTSHLMAGDKLYTNEDIEQYHSDSEEATYQYNQGVFRSIDKGKAEMRARENAAEMREIADNKQRLDNALLQAARHASELQIEKMKQAQEDNENEAKRQRKNRNRIRNLENENSNLESELRQQEVEQQIQEVQILRQDQLRKLDNIQRGFR